MNEDDDKVLNESIKKGKASKPSDTDQRVVIYRIEKCDNLCAFHHGEEQLCTHPETPNVMIIIRKGNLFPHFCKLPKYKDMGSLYQGEEPSAKAEARGATASTTE